MIISAEVHCSVAQQDLVAHIMRSVFGDALVSAPPDARPAITKLPSPEDLRGRVLLKAKNLYVTEKEGLKEKSITVDTESSESTTSSSSEASASDSEAVSRDVGSGLSKSLSKARNVDAVKGERASFPVKLLKKLVIDGMDLEIREEIQKPIKGEVDFVVPSIFSSNRAIAEIKEELSKARNLYDRVRGKKTPSPTEGLASPPKTPTQPPATLHPAPPVAGETSGTPTIVATTAMGAASPASTSGIIITNADRERSKVKMSLELLALLVYTVGVKCRGFNKKETYAPEHLFSLSERTANKVIKQSILDLIKHSRTHVVRIYPNGTRLSSSNFEPHRYWAAGAQLVAINWQTFGECRLLVCVDDVNAYGVLRRSGVYDQSVDVPEEWKGRVRP